MKAFLKIEWKRLFRNPGLWVSLGIGLLLSITQFFMIVCPSVRFLDTYMQKFAGLTMTMPHTVFTKWIGAEGYSVQRFTFFMILPLLCTIPWSLSAYQDKKSGLIKNYFIRGRKRDYYFAKYLVNFVSGGSVVVIPLLLNLALAAAVLPSLKPEVATGFYAVRSTSMFAKLFYTHPYTYTFVYLLIIFVFCGLISCFASSAGLWLDNGFTVILLPFVLHLFLYSVCSSSEVNRFAPFYFLNPAQDGDSISFWIILMEACILLVASLCTLRRGIKSETL